MQMNKTEKYILKAKLKHGDKYNYSKFDYINYREKVIIICRTHGEFLQTTSHHIHGTGCSQCSKVYKCTTEEWIEKAKNKFGNKFDFTKSIYKSAKEPITIICNLYI